MDCLATSQAAPEKTPTQEPIGETAPTSEVYLIFQNRETKERCIDSSPALHNLASRNFHSVVGTMSRR
jgi:hypothetical protein